MDKNKKDLIVVEEDILLEYIHKELQNIIHGYENSITGNAYLSIISILARLKCNTLLDIFVDKYSELFPLVENAEKVKVSISRLNNIISPWKPQKNEFRKPELIKDILTKIKNKDIGCHIYQDKDSNEYRLIINSQKKYLYSSKYDRYYELIMTYKTFKIL